MTVDTTKTPEEKPNYDESSYEQGNRAAWLNMLSQCLLHLGYKDSPEAAQTAWISEREQAIARLRILCDDFGDNDWDTDLHLADVIDKHLGKYLEETANE